jgi:hypothetical protein
MLFFSSGSVSHNIMDQCTTTKSDGSEFYSLWSLIMQRLYQSTLAIHQEARGWDRSGRDRPASPPCPKPFPNVPQTARWISTWRPVSIRPRNQGPQMFRTRQVCCLRRWCRIGFGFGWPHRRRSDPRDINRERMRFLAAAIHVCNAMFTCAQSFLWGLIAPNSNGSELKNMHFYRPVSCCAHTSRLSLACQYLNMFCFPNLCDCHMQIVLQ